MNLKELIEYNTEDYYDDAEAFYDIDDFGFEGVTEAEYGDKGRWYIQVSQVYKRVADNTYWCFSWQEGNTESQETDLDLCIEQVYPKQVTKTIYITKQGENNEV